MTSDVVPVLLAAARGDISRADMAFDPRAAVGIVLAADGYPGTVRTGDAIAGAEDAFPDGVEVFQAGTVRSSGGELVTAGGRVLTVCALGDTLGDASARAYGAAARIRFRGCQYRKDIGRHGA